MHALFFGPSQSQLFGVYHEPRTAARAKHRAVVICPSICEEYLIMHWSVRRLAEHLADAGFHVLRFDYSGTGDSGGDLFDGVFRRWTDDVVCAIEELHALAGDCQVNVIGFRIGALLAASAAGTTVSEGLDTLVLWEPVASGREFVDTMKANDRILRGRYENEFSAAAQRPDGASEFAGYVMPSGFEEEILQLDLAAALAGARKCLRVASVSSRHDADALDGVTHTSVAGADDWFAKFQDLQRINVDETTFSALQDVLSGPMR